MEEHHGLSDISMVPRENFETTEVEDNPLQEVEERGYECSEDAVLIPQRQTLQSESGDVVDMVDESIMPSLPMFHRSRPRQPMGQKKKRKRADDDDEDYIDEEEERVTKGQRDNEDDDIIPISGGGMYCGISSSSNNDIAVGSERENAAGPPVTESNNGEELFKCEFPGCNAAYKNQDSLKQHIMRGAHVGKGTMPRLPNREGHLESRNAVKDSDGYYRCKEKGCESKAFNKLGNYIRHLVTHSEERPYTCTYAGCEKSYKKKEYLTLHLKTHQEDRPFKCQHEGCGKAFKLQQILNAHKSAHITERSFPCEFPGCSHASKTSVDLKKHQKIHSGVKPHKCNHEGCDKAFAESGDLKKHLRTHTGERPYKCEYCDKDFTHSGKLISHKKSQHPEHGHDLIDQELDGDVDHDDDDLRHMTDMRVGNGMRREMLVRQVGDDVCVEDDGTVGEVPMYDIFDGNIVGIDDGVVHTGSM